MHQLTLFNTIYDIKKKLDIIKPIFQLDLQIVPAAFSVPPQHRAKCDPRLRRGIASPSTFICRFPNFTLAIRASWLGKASS